MTIILWFAAVVEDQMGAEAKISFYRFTLHKLHVYLTSTVSVCYLIIDMMDIKTMEYKIQFKISNFSMIRILPIYSNVRPSLAKATTILRKL